MEYYAFAVPCIMYAVVNEWISKKTSMFSVLVIFSCAYHGLLSGCVTCSSKEHHPGIGVHISNAAASKMIKADKKPCYILTAYTWNTPILDYQ